MLQNISQESIIDSDDIYINNTTIDINISLKNNINTEYKNKNKNNNKNKQTILDTPPVYINSDAVLYNPYNYDITTINQLQNKWDTSDINSCICLIISIALVITFAIVYKNT